MHPTPTRTPTPNPNPQPKPLSTYRLPVDEIALRVALPRLDQRKIAAQRVLQYVLARLGAVVAREGMAKVLRAARRRAGSYRSRTIVSISRRHAAVLHKRARAGPREKGGDARARCTHPFGQRAHRHKLNDHLAVQVLLLEDLVLTDVRPHHLPDLLGLKEQAESTLVRAHIARDDRQPSRTLVLDRAEQVLGHAAQPKATHEELASVLNVMAGSGRRWEDFLACDSGHHSDRWQPRWCDSGHHSARAHGSSRAQHPAARITSRGGEVRRTPPQRSRFEMHLLAASASAPPPPRLRRAGDRGGALVARASPRCGGLVAYS